MKFFRITYEINPFPYHKRAWFVKAESEEEALTKIQDGDFDISRAVSIVELDEWISYDQLQSPISIF